MANTLTGNPLIVDTVTATTHIAGSITPTLVYWVGATAGHDLTIKDKGGVTRMVAKAVTAADVLPFPPRFTMGGLGVTTLGSGTLYIYFREKAPLT